MKIALLNTMTPYVRGGAEILIDDLAEQLNIHGHNADVFRLPFPDSYDSPLVRTITASQMLRFEEYERVITFKFPAYYVRHPAKVIWLFHQYRQVYDLWGTEYGLKTDRGTDTLKEIIKLADEKSIKSSRHVYTIAGEVTKRLKRYNNIDSQVIYPPLKNANRYYSEKTGDYFFYPSRITELKRQLLAIEAMRYVKSTVKLVIAGMEEKGYFEGINKVIRQYKLKDKVIIHNKWVCEEEKLKFMAQSLGCIFVPYAEDYGFVTLEAFYSSKPVITCIDSGGSTEFVEDGKTGYITEPTPQSIAIAMDKLYEDKQLASRMGTMAFEEISKRNISWDETIRRLLI